jgi:hypothetical protein
MYIRKKSIMAERDAWHIVGAAHFNHDNAVYAVHHSYNFDLRSYLKLYYIKSYLLIKQ